MKKIIISLFIMIIGVIIPYLYNVKVNAENDIANNSTSAILLNADTGDILFEKNSETPLPPASMTKVMSIILFMEALENNVIKNEELIITSEHASKMGGSQIFLSVGEEMSVSDLLKSVIIASANDACVALAEKIAGSEEEFVKMMNKKAKSLNLKSTNFVNATGLPTENHYTTSKDMAIMSMHLINNYPNIIKLSSTYEDYIRKDSDNPFWLVNTNKLVKHAPGIDGLKTGWTVDAGYCLTATSYNADNKMRLIAVAMGCETPQKRNSDIVGMLNYGHSNYKNNLLLSKGDIVLVQKNILSIPEEVKIVVNKDYYICLKKQEKIPNYNYKLELNNDSQNEEIGQLKIYCDEEYIGKVGVVYLEKVKNTNFWVLLFRIIKQLFN